MISVIIPVYNAKETIKECLLSLESQTLSRDKYEIITVDDGSTDDTAEIIKRFNKVKYIYQKNSGPAVARNNGVKHSAGDIILFTDSDCEVFNNWIEEMIKPFSDPPVAGVKGAYETKQKKAVAKFVQLEYESKYDRLKKFDNIDFIDTYSAGFRKKIFMDFSGYDDKFTVACAEDVDLSFRMSEKNLKMKFNKNALVYHRHPDSFMNYLKKKYKFAFWRVLALKKNPSKISSDTHTPQIMKLQLLLAPLILVLLFYSIVNASYSALFVLSMSYLLLSLPMMLKGMTKYGLFMLGFSFFMLYFRGLSQFWGLLNGIFKFLRLEKC